MTGEFPAQKASITENVSIWWRHHEDIAYFTWLLTTTVTAMAMFSSVETRITRDQAISYSWHGIHGNYIRLEGWSGAPNTLCQPYRWQIASKMIILSLCAVSVVNHDHDHEGQDEEEDGGWVGWVSWTMTYHIFTIPTTAAKATTTTATNTATTIPISVKSTEQECSKRWTVWWN